MIKQTNTNGYALVLLPVEFLDKTFLLTSKISDSMDKIENEEDLL